MKSASISRGAQIPCQTFSMKGLGEKLSSARRMLTPNSSPSFLMWLAYTCAILALNGISTNTSILFRLVGPPEDGDNGHSRRVPG